MIVPLLILGIVAQVYSAPQDNSEVDPKLHTPDDRCPPSEVYYLLPHEYDCTKFYYCEYGQRYIKPRDCALGTHFAYEIQVCVHPEQAGCTLPGPPTSSSPSSTISTTSPPPSSTVSTTSPPPSSTISTTSTAPSSTISTTTTTSAPSSPVSTTSTTPSSTTSTTTSAPSSTTTPPGGGFLPNGCPSDFNVNWHLPHETDCGKFYQCVNGEKVERICYQGLHFNPIKQRCDLPADAGCESGNGGGGGQTTTPSSTVSTSSTAPSSTTTPPGGPGNETLPNGCPADFNIIWHLPHETDCGKFYQCVNGEKVERICYHGLHFNPIKQRCDFPADAGCETGSGGGGGQTTTPSSTVSTTSNKPPSTNSTTITTSAPSSTVSTTSTTAPSTNSTTTITTNAPSSTVSTTSTTPPSTTSTTTTTSPSTNSTTITTSAPSSTVSTTSTTPSSTTSTTTSAPSSTVSTTSTTPSSTVSTTFTTPSSTVSTTSTTPPSTNSTTITTSAPSSTVSITSTTPSSTTSTTTTSAPSSPVSTTSTTPSSTTSTTTSAPSSTTKAPGGGFLPNGCPSNFNINWHLPHETDCGKFYHCVHGHKLERSCSPGLHFNPIKQICDWPANAGCESGSGGGQTTSTTPSSTVSTTSATPPSTNSTTITTSAPSSTVSTTLTTPSSTTSTTTSAPSSTTAAPGGGFLPNGCPSNFNINWHLPHETDCGKFYHCVHGHKLERSCSPGLHFNPIKQICDWPANAGCESGSGGGQTTSTTPSSTVSTTSTTPSSTTSSPSTNSTTTSVPTSTTSSPSTNSTTTSVPTSTTSPPSTTSTTTSAPTSTTSLPSTTSTTTSAPTSTTPPPSTTSTTTSAPTSPTPPPSTTSTTTSAPTSPTPPGGGGTESDRCKDNCHVPHWSHETDCDKFWRCVGNQKVLGICSEGLHFNELTQTCDFMCNVGCERKVVQTTFQRDGLKIFMPWDKVDKLLKLSNLNDFLQINFGSL